VAYPELKSRNLLDSRSGRFLSFGLLYLSEGIPYGFSSVALVAFMRMEGLSLEQTGAFVAAILLPWSFKWAWAPLIDIVKLNRLGGRKAWIVSCTTMMIITLLITATIDFVANFQLLLIMIVLNNFFCATQDVAIDSLAVSTLTEEERGRGNGFMFGGQNLGIAMGGGGAILVFGLWGFDVALMYVSGMLFLNLLFVIFFVEDPGVAIPAEEQQDGSLRKVIDTVGSFFKDLYASFLKSGAAPKFGLVFSILPVGTLALAYATLTTIQVDYGLDELRIGQLSAANTVAAATGSLIGGALADRFGIRKMLALFYVLTMLPALYLAIQISVAGLNSVMLELFYGAIILHGLFYGAAFGLHAAVLMGLTNPVVAATQFTLFMGMTNLAVVIANYWQGIVAERIDYAMVLYIDSLIVIAPLAVIPFLKSREEQAAGAEMPSRAG
jgi:PAT family beta-lactamase induction signal transducer AmpG